MVSIAMARKPADNVLEKFSAVDLRNIAAEMQMFAAQLEAVAMEMETRRLRGIPNRGKYL